MKNKLIDESETVKFEDMLFSELMVYRLAYSVQKLRDERIYVCGSWKEKFHLE